MPVRLGQEVQEVSRSDAVDSRSDSSSPGPEEPGVSGLRAVILTPEDAPFVDAASEQLVVVLDHDTPVAAAPLDWSRAPSLPGRAARVAVLHPLRYATAAGDSPDESRRSDLYALILQTVSFQRPRPDLIVVRLNAATEGHASLLWPLALALDGRCEIVDTGAEVVVTTVLPGTIAAIAAARMRAATADVPGLLRLVRRPGALWRRLVGARKRLPPALTVWHASTATSMTPIIVPELVFTRVPSDEVQRRPVRYGLALTTPARFFGAAECYLAKLDGATVHRLWISFDDKIIQTRIASAGRAVPRTPIAKIWGCFTPPRFRGRGIYPATLQWAITLCRERGMQSVVLEVAADNTASIRGARKAGFEPL